MRELWVQLESTSKELTESLLRVCKHQCSTVLTDSGGVELAKSYGFQVASSRGGDIQIIDKDSFESIEELKKQGKPICLRLTVMNRGDEAEAIKAVNMGVDYIIISCPNWKIIPLENLIAQSQGRTKLIAEVSNSQEARTALETLEIGADGVIVKSSNPKEIGATVTLIKRIGTLSRSEKSKIGLVPAKVILCRPLSMGSRVCIDTCDLMVNGEGMLVGCQSSGLFLVQAEVEETPHIEPRPFRVNAGPVSLYVLTPDNKTRYLSELRAGDEVLIVGRDGGYRTGIVGRIKIEKRPLSLVEAIVDGNKIKVIVQNAETIRLVCKDGSKSVSELKTDDEILVYYQAGGRHFGVLVSEESIIER
ncbi:MAG: 3-dehydroquinate synthase [Thermoproteota archaeon]|nr:3-dehydroquinate synthase [Thermoproteota archaeon]